LGLKRDRVEQALNVDAAEASKIGTGEPYATLGYTAWVSTFYLFAD
jgi:hypothetical protein